MVSCPFLSLHHLFFVWYTHCKCTAGFSTRIGEGLRMQRFDWQLVFFLFDKMVNPRAKPSDLFFVYDQVDLKFVFGAVY